MYDQKLLQLFVRNYQIYEDETSNLQNLLISFVWECFLEAKKTIHYFHLQDECEGTKNYRKDI